MLVEVKVPQLSESVAEATLLSWHKKAGDYVKRDENLVDALPDASTEAVLIDFITSGQFTQATFLATLAAHQINQDHIGLTGLQQNGMEYL